MTLSPLVDPAIRGMDGDHYKVSPVCCVPACRRRSEHAHHIWPRSALRRQPQNWVRLPSGQVIGNLAGLCVQHHLDVTGDTGGHRAWMRLDEETEALWWRERAPEDGQWIDVGPLVPQPPRAGERLAEAVEGAYVCPTCGHVHKPEVHEPTKPRPTASWTVTVPKDAEVGTAVLDVLIDELALILGAEEWTSRLKRYHVLVPVLYWAVQNRTQLLHDLEESGGN